MTAETVAEAALAAVFYSTLNRVATPILEQFNLALLLVV
jgi:hypothetical protein